MNRNDKKMKDITILDFKSLKIVTSLKRNFPSIHIGYELRENWNKNRIGLNERYNLIVYIRRQN